MYDKQSKLQIFWLLIIATILSAFYIFYNFHSEYILTLRIKKIMAVVVVCYATGYSTVAFQAVTSNHIITPSIMGLESLYIFLQTLAIYLIGSSKLNNMNTLGEFFISLIFMVAFSLILYVYIFGKVSSNVNLIVLCGIIIGGFFYSLSNFMQVLLDPNEFLILQGKIFASINKVAYNYLFVSIIIAAIILIISFKYMSTLDVLSLGRENAISLGINYPRIVKKIFIQISILVSLSTVLVGPMTFLGIIVVSITRYRLKSFKHKYKTIYATLIGIILLVISLLIMERLLSYDTAVSIVINFIGGIYFIYLIIKENKRNVRG